MKYFFISIVLFFFAQLPLHAQSIKGKITDEENQPMPYVTAYIVELKTGAISNNKGEFFINAEEGNYTLRFQYLGYQTQTKQISVPLNSNLNIQLQPSHFQIKEFTVSAKAEDPAFNIIRKAIAKAPFYEDLVTYSKSNVYIKGTFLIEKIPALFKQTAALNGGKERLPFKEGDVFVKESVNEITRTQEKTLQKILSVNNSFPSSFSMDSVSGIFDAFTLWNVYAKPKNNEYVSPISASALSYYNYILEGSKTQEDGITIHHIQVIPKTGNPMLFKGTIDIIESLWCVHNFDLSGRISLGPISYDFKFQEMFSELEKDIWLPISYVNQITPSILGIKFGFTNTAAIKYLEYTIKDSEKGNVLNYQVQDTIKDSIDFVISEKSKKIQDEITSLSKKEKLSTREAMKILKLVEKKEKEDKNNNKSLYKKESLEVKQTYFVTTDSNALKSDSLYWSMHRASPLSLEEETGFRNKGIFASKDRDSLKSKNKFSFGFTGYQIRIDSSSTLDGNFSSVGFNTVDGFYFSIGNSFNKKFRNAKQWKFGFDLGYNFSTKHLPYAIYSSFNYMPLKQASVSIEGGRKSSDFNSSSGINGIINTVSSLFFRQNYINFYDKSYVTIKHNIEVFNGFKVDAGFTYEDQKHLNNTSNYSFFFRESRNYRSNTPDNTLLLDNSIYLQNASSSVFDLKLQYTPKMKYEFKRGRKINLGSNFPTFAVLWKKGIVGLLDATNNFDQVELNIQQKIHLGLFESFNYNASAGWFPNNRNIHFSNFKHFRTHEFPFMISSLENTYHTMSTYSGSTNEWYLSAFTQYATPYLLLKHLPFLDKTLIVENIYASYLKTPFVKDYLEVGYGLTNIYMFGSLGVFVGLEDFKYANWGFKLAIGIPNL